ncbi:MAG TPA: CcmD family protein [Chitinophagales bacterium]|nr:CcmD family protein [Chitinophagales bacterium]
MKKFLNIILLLTLSLATFAQGDTGAEDLFRSNLKIYVVVGVLTIIMACMFAFLFAIERRLKKLEEKN